MKTKRKQRTAADYNRLEEKRALKTAIQITPPEGVPLRFERASMGARFGAQLLDLLITYGTLIALFIVVGLNVNFGWNTFMAFFALLSFLVRIPYYILTELVWNGRTIGKHLVKLRVISADGRRLEPHQVVVRNLMKEAEVFTPISLLFGVVYGTGWVRLGMAIWLLGVILVPIFSKRNQRLGDIIAGTYVIVQPKVERASEITEAAKALPDQFVFLPIHLEHYGRFELQSLEKVLRDKGTMPIDVKRDIDIAKAICRKIGFTDRFPPNESRPFLSAFYNAQRAHLEARQMFGDKRENKFELDERNNRK